MDSTPHLVATDIDGTLLRDDRTLSARTAAVLARVADQGTPVVLVTGRPIRWLRLVYDQLAAPLPAICANGAVVYDRPPTRCCGPTRWPRNCSPRWSAACGPRYPG